MCLATSEHSRCIRGCTTISKSSNVAVLTVLTFSNSIRIKILKQYCNQLPHYCLEMVVRSPMYRLCSEVSKDYISSIVLKCSNIRLPRCQYRSGGTSFQITSCDPKSSSKPNFLYIYVTKLNRAGFVVLVIKTGTQSLKYEYLPRCASANGLMRYL